MDKVEFTVPLTNKRGLHARAAAKLVKLAEEHPCHVYIHCNGKRVPAVSIIELLLLGARLGDTIQVQCEGEGADKVASALHKLIDNKFDEE